MFNYGLCHFSNVCNIENNDRNNVETDNLHLYSSLFWAKKPYQLCEFKERDTIFCSVAQSYGDRRNICKVTGLLEFSWYFLVIPLGLMLYHNFISRPAQWNGLRRFPEFRWVFRISPAPTSMTHVKSFVFGRVLWYRGFMPFESLQWI